MSIDMRLNLHAYAPELNTLEYKNRVFKVPRCTSFLEAKRHIGITKPKRFVKYATIDFIYNNPNMSWLNSCYKGTVDSYKQLQEFIELKQQSHTLADNINISIKSKYI